MDDDQPLIKKWTALLAILASLSSFTQPGASAQGMRDPSAVYAADHGAKCDGQTDDAPAINATIETIRQGVKAPGESWPIGHVGRLVLPRGRCVIRRTLNFTGLYGSGFVADLFGSLIDCRVKGGTCIDVSGSGQVTILGLGLHGDKTDMPRIGLLLGRISDTSIEGSDHDDLDHPTISGFYALAAYYNHSSETTHVTTGWFGNYQPGSFAAIFDGSNHFDIQSAFTGKTYRKDHFSSFAENSCTTCIFSSLGKDSVPLWIGGTTRHKFYNSYLFNDGSGTKPGVILWFGNGISNDFLQLDMHMENKGLGAAIEIQGAPSVTIRGFSYEDPMPEQSGPLFRRGPGVEHVALEGTQLKIGQLTGKGAGWWDQPAAFSLSGQVYSADGTFVAPGAFSGTVCARDKCVTR